MVELNHLSLKKKLCCIKQHSFACLDSLLSFSSGSVLPDRTDLNTLVPGMAHLLPTLTRNTACLRARDKSSVRAIRLPGSPVGAMNALLW